MVSSSIGMVEFLDDPGVEDMKIGARNLERDTRDINMKASSGSSIRYYTLS